MFVLWLQLMHMQKNTFRRKNTLSNNHALNFVPRRARARHHAHTY